ncbi:hypothetical protein HN873_053085 [Arachis hypogaea]
MARNSGFSLHLHKLDLYRRAEICWKLASDPRLRQKRREHRLDQHTIDLEHPLIEVVFPTHLLAGFYTLKGLMSNVEDNKEQRQMDVNASNESSNMPSSQKQVEEAIKKKYGGMMPKKPPLISKDHERAYFDSADWALGKQGGEKPKGPLEALRPKLQPTQQQTRYRKSPYAPEGEEGGSVPPEDSPSNE